MHGEGRFDVLGNRVLVGGDGDLDDVAFVARSTRFIGDFSADLGVVQRQLLKFPGISATDVFQALLDRCVGAHIDVIRRSHNDRAGSAVGRHGNHGLTVAQREVQRRVIVDRQSVFAGQRHGVGDLAAFGDRLGGGQFGHHFVNGIGDFHRGRVTQLQVLEGRASGINGRLNTQDDLASILVNVVALSLVGVRFARSLARLDGHDRVVAQGHGQVMRQHRVDVHGEGRFDVLGNRVLVSGDGDLDDVAFVARSTWLVSDGGADRGLVQGQLLELPRIRTADCIDGIDHRVVGAHIDVVWRSYSFRAGSAVRWHQDHGLTVTQGEVQVRVVIDRQTIFVGQRHRVGDLAAFGDRGSRRQLGHDFVDGVGDFHRGITTQLQVFEGSTVDIRCRFDTQADLASILINVVALCVMGVRHAGFTSLDGDLGIVAQGHDQVMIQCGVDVHGEARLDVLGHRGLICRDGDLYQVTLVTGARSARAWLISYRGGDGIAAERQLLEAVCARYRLEFVGNGSLTTDINIIVDRDGRAARSAVGRDGDLRTIGESEGQRAVLGDG